MLRLLISKNSQESICSHLPINLWTWGGGLGPKGGLGSCPFIAFLSGHCYWKGEGDKLSSGKPGQSGRKVFRADFRELLEEAQVLLEFSEDWNE